jgi:hypothetical protein
MIFTLVHLPRLKEQQESIELINPTNQYIWYMPKMHGKGISIYEACLLDMLSSSPSDLCTRGKFYESFKDRRAINDYLYPKHSYIGIDIYSSFSIDINQNNLVSMNFLQSSYQNPTLFEAIRVLFLCEHFWLRDKQYIKVKNNNQLDYKNQLLIMIKYHRRLNWLIHIN